MERIITIDPGLANVGYAIMKKSEKFNESDGARRRSLLSYGLITTSPKHPLTYRIRVIRGALRHLIGKFGCTVLVLEDFYGSAGMQNRKAVVDIAKVHGAIQSLPIKVILVSPVSVQPRQKKRNRAKKKKSTVNYINKTYGLELPIGHHHVADAIIQGEYYYGKTW